MSIKKVRDEVAKYNTKIANGINPLDELKQEKGIQILKDVFELYIAERKENPTKKQDIKRFNNYVKVLHSIQINKIKKADIKSLHKSLEKSPYLANRIIELLKSIFNYAIIELEINIPNPCVGLKKYQENPRERILNPVELKRFIDVLEKWAILPNRFVDSDIFKVMLYTGMRKNNCLKMKFSDIDLESETWTLQPEMTKGKKRIIVALHDIVLQILRRKHIELNNRSIFVFPSPIYPDRPIAEPKRQWTHLLEEANLKNLTIHDIRKTFGAYLLMSCKDIRTVQDALGHSSIKQTADAYTPLTLDHKRKAINRIFNQSIDVIDEKP